MLGTAELRRESGALGDSRGRAQSVGATPVKNGCVFKAVAAVTRCSGSHLNMSTIKDTPTWLRGNGPPAGSAAIRNAVASTVRGGLSTNPSISGSMSSSWLCIHGHFPVIKHITMTPMLHKSLEASTRPGREGAFNSGAST